MQLTIVLVCIGQFQEYILSNIRNLIRLQNSRIIVITSSEWFSKFDTYDVQLVAVENLHDSYGYMSKSTQDKAFRGGFWALASERFFYLYAYMRESGLENVIHLENDVLIYYNVQELSPYLANFRTEGAFGRTEGAFGRTEGAFGRTEGDRTEGAFGKIVLPFDAYSRNIASIVYIPTADVLQQVLDKYNMNLNDMQNFVEIRKTGGPIDSFPIMSTCEEDDECRYVTQNYDKFGGFIFDAAAIGQYLGGVDPRNKSGDTRGFVNETCVIKYDKYTFEWVNGRPYLCVHNTQIPIFNLHIHCKDLEAFIRTENTDTTVTDTTVTDTTDKKKKKKKKNAYPNFDIVIPVGPNEVENFHKQLDRVKKYVSGYRNIYIVTNTKSSAKGTSSFAEFAVPNEGCILIDESIFPFSMSDIAQHFAKHKGKDNRNGWYLQQLIKLYAGFTIPNILDNYLVVDADVFFLRPIDFFNRITEIDSSGRREYVQYCFCIGTERFPAYFDHMKTLHPTLRRMEAAKSGICHHMMFCKQYVRELFALVESEHTGQKPFWRIFIESVKEHLKHEPTYLESGASEYEIYFNFMLMHHPDKVFTRKLKWRNISCKSADNMDIMDTTYQGNDFVSVCWYKM